MSAALSRGGQYADIYAEDTTVTSIELQDGKVSQAQQAVLYGAGIRVVHNGQTGYAYTMDLSEPSLKEAARFAASISGNAVSNGKGLILPPDNSCRPASKTGKTRLPQNLHPPLAKITRLFREDVALSKIKFGFILYIPCLFVTSQPENRKRNQKGL